MSFSPPRRRSRPATPLVWNVKLLVWNMKLLQVHGLITFGQLLDASSLQAALAVAVCFVGLGLERMAQYIDSTKVVYAASTAVLSLCRVMPRNPIVPRLAAPCGASWTSRTGPGAPGSSGARQTG